MPAVKNAVTVEEPASRNDALAELGLAPSASDDDVRDAFRLRIKTAHPDLNGGTDTLLRRLILARDLLMTEPRHTIDALPAHSDEPLRLDITLVQALSGGIAEARVPALDVMPADEALTSLIQMTTLGVPLTPGLRHGETIAITPEGARKTFHFRIHVTCDSGQRVWGNDIWMTAVVPPRLLALGGETTIETPHGPQEIALDRDTAAGSSLCLKGLGLPQTETLAAGDLHIRLEPGEDARAYADSIDAFRQRWAS